MRNLFHDVWAIMYKEWREWLAVRSNLVTVSAGLLVCGVVIPWAAGPLWASDMLLLVWAWLPMLLVAGTAADAFAGERERGTLASLLASRLPDGAIVLGKVLAVAIFAWGVILACVILGLGVMALVHGGAPLTTTGSLIGAALIVGALVAGFTANLGVLISLRAASVRQAQQLVSICLLLAFLVVVYAAAQFGKSPFTGFTLGAPTLVQDAGILLAAVNTALLVGLLLRFQRNHLLDR